jgi:hypothetical protein
LLAAASDPITGERRRPEPSSAPPMPVVLGEPRHRLSCPAHSPGTPPALSPASSSITGRRAVGRRATAPAVGAMTVPSMRAPPTWASPGRFGRWARLVLLGRGPLLAHGLFSVFQFPKFFFLLKVSDIRLSF